jgi:hypothetical protein
VQREQLPVFDLVGVRMRLVHLGVEQERALPRKLDALMIPRDAMNAQRARC